MAQPEEQSEMKLELASEDGAASNIKDEELASDCECPDYCGEFLDSLPDETKGRVVHLIHSVLKKKMDVYVPCCETFLKEIEKEYGVQSFLSGHILKQIVIALNKIGQTDDALQLVERRLSLLNSEDFTTLIVLGLVYDKKGEYQNAFETYRRANDSANQNGDNLQGALSLVKLATSCWNLEQPEQSRQFRDKGQRTFEQTDVKITSDLSPEVLILLLDYYKTVGYLHKTAKEFEESRRCHSIALDIIKKNGCSRVQELKTLSWLAHSYSQVKDNLAVERYAERAVHIVEEILKLNTYISVHANQIISIMSRLAFSYSYIGKAAAALQVRERNLGIARDFLGDAHPEVARTAADIILTCRKTNEPRRADEFYDIYEKSLELCQYKNDEKIMKCFVRELSDALNNFAFACILLSNYSQAEMSYKESLEINKKVYGDMHPRTSKVLRFLGRMYNKWGKHDQAREMLSASLAIIERYQPDDTELLRSIKKELDYSGRSFKSRRGHLFRK